MNLLFKQEAGSVGRRTRTLSNKNHIQIIRCQEEACKHVCVRAQCPFVKTSALSCNQSERPQRTDEASTAQQDEVLSENTLKKKNHLKI